MREHKDVGATVGTPWGPASELRERRLYPGAGTPPEEVARNQRERLFGAIVAVASEKGYEAMTVADVLALSGVSRSAFYRHFASKAECLTAAVAQFLVPAIEGLNPASANGDRPEPQRLFEGFLELLGSEPAATRVSFVELPAAGREGAEVADEAFEALVDGIGGLLGSTGQSPDLVRALAGGIGKLIHTRAGRGEAADLAGLAPELWLWMESVVPPPRSLDSPRRQRAISGTRFEGYTPGERIARAVATVVAEKGYAGTNTDDIAAQAAISLSTFYAHFEDKRDAVVGALEMSGAQITALAVPAARRAGNWQEGVRAMYEAICAYFVAEPAMAQLATAGVFGAGARARGRRDRVIDSLTEMLAPGLVENPQAPALSPEAIGATVYALIWEQVRRGGPEGLGAIVPLATYITLVGFVGPDQALAVANGKSR